MKAYQFGIIGFVVGAAVGICISAKYFDEKYRIIADEEIESVKDKFKDIARNKMVSDDSKEKPTKEEESEDAPVRKIKHDYSKITATYKSDDIDEAERRRQQEDESPHVIISEDDFGTDGYDTDSLVFYTGDNVLLDSMGDEANERELVGWCLTNLPDLNSPDTSIVYVRNQEIGIDFEIEIIHDFLNDPEKEPEGVDPRE